jgi:CelD/BcsL family acetyltransferase involved in cellulose biosynthesis
MKVTVVRPGELGTPELELWREMARGSAALRNPFLSPEFTLAVGNARPAARVGVLEESSRIVGFFPHERRGRLLGTAVGAGISDCQALVHLPGLVWDAKELVRACGLPVWEFDHLIASQPAFAPHHTARHGSPVLDLSRGFPAYVQARSRETNAITSLGRKVRKLAREVGELRFDFQSTDPAALRTLMDWKSDQYRRTRARDNFDTPWITQVVTELLGTQAAGCTGTLSVLHAGDRPIAAHFGIRSEDVLSYWFPSYDPAFGRYSTGIILLLRLAEAAADQGVTSVDLGRGQQRYKDELKSRELVVAEGRVGASGPAVAVRRTRAAVRSGASRALSGAALRPARDLAKLVRNRLLAGARARAR